MALIDFIRTSDLKRLVSDTNVEVKYLLYPPHAESQAELGVGDGDPDRPGAIMSVDDGGSTKIAVYQGDGTWSIIGGGSAGPSIIKNDSVNYPATTSAYLDAAYPSSRPGDVVWSETNNIEFIKMGTGYWNFRALNKS